MTHLPRKPAPRGALGALRLDAGAIDRRAVLAGVGALGAAALLPSGLWAQASNTASPALGVFTLGDPDAPVHIIEYASLTCPHCATFHAAVYPELMRDYIDTGKARIEFREVYFDRYGLWAGMLARCGGEERYFGFISELLGRQATWARSEDVLDEFKKIGRLGGLSEAEVEACVTDPVAQRALVEQYQEYHQDPLLTGTPTLVVDGKKVDNPSFRNLSSAIEAALGS